MMTYFVMKEFECRDGCRMPAAAKENIEALVEQVLDPVRRAYGKAICVTSGYRCPSHNARVGGVPQSQHVVGQAADIRPAEQKDGALERLARTVVANGKWDQMILYPTFIHISWKRSGINRRQILRKTAGGYRQTDINQLK